jgi:hypothetical protein
LAKLNFANDLSFFGEKEAESSPVADWQNGNRLNSGLLMRGAGAMPPHIDEAKGSWGAPRAN